MEKSGISFPCTRWQDDAWRMFLFLSKYLEISVGKRNKAGTISQRPGEAKLGALVWWHVLRGTRPKDHSKYIDPQENLFAI